MTIEDLLKQLEAERKVLEEEYRTYYDKAVEAKQEIKQFYEDPFLSPSEIPQELIDECVRYEKLHTVAVYKHNDILGTINMIKERL